LRSPLYVLIMKCWWYFFTRDPSNGCLWWL